MYSFSFQLYFALSFVSAFEETVHIYQFSYGWRSVGLFNLWGKIIFSLLLFFFKSWGIPYLWISFVVFSVVILRLFPWFVNLSHANSVIYSEEIFCSNQIPLCWFSFFMHSDMYHLQRSALFPFCFQLERFLRQMVLYLLLVNLPSLSSLSLFGVSFSLEIS